MKYRTKSSESMSTVKPNVDSFFDKAKMWQSEMSTLRALVLETGLNEVLKWYQPCYTLENKNVCIISSLKEFCILGFFKGALLSDTEQLLYTHGKNSQASRSLCFTSAEQIVKSKSVIIQYIHEAILLEKNGSKIVYKKTEEYPIPEELTNEFAGNPALKEAFYALTPGRQRGYLLHFGSAKHSTTRYTRIKKSEEQIKQGKGYNE